MIFSELNQVTLRVCMGKFAGSDTLSSLKFVCNSSDGKMQVLNLSHCLQWWLLRYLFLAFADRGYS